FLVQYQGLDPGILEWRRRKSLFGDEISPIKDSPLKSSSGDNKENEEIKEKKKKGISKRKKRKLNSKSRIPSPLPIRKEQVNDNIIDISIEPVLELQKPKSKKSKKSNKRNQAKDTSNS